MWTTSVEDLRTLLSDGPTDRFNFRKQCFGECNGTNKEFKTFEPRRLTDFTADTGVYINGVLQLTSAISTDDTTKGIFSFVAAPVDGDLVEASYYIQWFMDSELSQFLSDASLWLTSSTDVTAISGGLISSALKYACANAYLKMATKWKEWLSQAYKVEDLPQKEGSGPTQDFIALAKQYKAEATMLRNEFYKRQGRSLQPLWSTIVGNIGNMP